MKVIFLHGSPATGKLTVAKALLRLRTGRLLDNHAAIDFARNIFEFGVLGFWELVQDVRLQALRTASKYDVPFLLLTFCYSDPSDLPIFEEFERVVLNAHGELLPVFLHCSELEIARRIGNSDRALRGKTSSMEGLRKYRINYNDAPVPRLNCLKLDSGAGPAEKTAREIITHFGL